MASNIRDASLSAYNYLCLLVSEQVTDSMLTHASFIYPENTPTTKEAYYYRTIFEKFFPKVRYKFCKKRRKGTWLHERNIFTHVIILAFLHFFIYYGVGERFLYTLFSSTRRRIVSDETMMGMPLSLLSCHINLT